MTSLKTDFCSFSGFRIYPGHGKRYVRGDSKKVQFVSRKCEKSFLNKDNPRKTEWTQVYRRLHKKGRDAEIIRVKRRKIIKVRRDLVSASQTDLRAQRAKRAAIREATKQAAIKEIKERKKKRDAKGKKGGVARKGGAAPKKGGKSHGGKGR